MSLSELRNHFPQLKLKYNDNSLVYLDSAASTVKPHSVIDRMTEYYKNESCNVHRGAHFLSDQATENYEEVRSQIATFLGSTNSSEVIFTKGTTEGINLLANTLGQSLNLGDEIILSVMEHHSNIVPWHMLAKAKNLKLKFVNLDKNGDLDFDHFSSLLTSKTKIVSLVHCSNALGTINPVSKFFKLAKSFGAVCILDSAQSVSFLELNVNQLHADFLVFSGHKFFAPTGVGVLWGRIELLNTLPPYQGGGSMIEKVSLEDVTYLESPHRFEAGTPPIGQVIGLGEALKFFQNISIHEIQKHEETLMNDVINELKNFKNVEIYGSPKQRGNIVSFNVKDVHSSDIGMILNQQAIVLRTGHHCAQPLMNSLGVSGTIRCSISIYNNQDDIEKFIKSFKKAVGFFI